MAQGITISIVQCASVWEDKAATFAHVDALIDSAMPAPESLIVLPELFDTGFSFNVSATHDQAGQTLHYLKALASRTRCTVHGSRTLLGSDGRGRNCATIVSADGRVVCEYAKIHPFSIGKESQFFSGGERIVNYALATSSGTTTIGPSICYDLRFSELYRAQVSAGAEVLVVPANWPAVRQMHRLALARARAIENQCICVSVNRAGSDPSFAYGGASSIFDAKGEIILELDERPQVASMSIDLDALRTWRAAFPVLADRKPTVYALPVERM